MSKALRVVLSGIVIILASLFLMGICIIRAKTGGPEGWTLALFIVGLIVSGIGLFFVED